jgi:hypothetical protein
MPDWLNWSNVLKVAALVPGWIAFAMTIRKAWFERTILEFIVEQMLVESEAIDEANTMVEADAIAEAEEEGWAEPVEIAGFVTALKIVVTNDGQRPITIQKLKCRYALKPEHGRPWLTSAVSVNKKIGQGEHCVGYARLHFKTTAIIKAVAIDSTGKEWPVPKSTIKRLNKRTRRT